MERLSKKQREILKYLYDESPQRFVKMDELLYMLEDGYGEVSLEIKLLKEKDLVKSSRISKRYHHHVYLNITPKGIEKLRENIITRLIDTAYNNPWAVIAIVLSVIFGLITLWR